MHVRVFKSSCIQIPAGLLLGAPLRQPSFKLSPTSWPLETFISRANQESRPPTEHDGTGVFLIPPQRAQFLCKGICTPCQR